MRKSLTDNGVAALKPRAKRYAHSDPELAGHYVIVQPTGVKSFSAVTRDPSGKQIWTRIGSPDPEVLTIEKSRVRAREIMGRVRDGLPAKEPKGKTFGDGVEEWLTREVRGKLRSAREYERMFDRYILPAWKDREFDSIRRSEVADLIDHIEDTHGLRQARYCYAVIRRVMNWTAARSDDYRPPIMRGMRLGSPAAQARPRIFSDDEIVKVWNAADQCGTFGAYVQISLLTAQRREKVSSMRWSDVENGVWTIPVAPREKSTAGTLALPDMALRIIDAQPKFDTNPYIFAGRSAGPINGFSKMKANLDRLSGVSDWRLHDLRRTARSLMSRAGVLSEHAERVMGHAIAGIEGVYDRHQYRAEKADALQRLGALIDGIVHLRSADVLPMTRRRAAK